MIKLDHKSIDSMPAGRGMDVCLAVLVMRNRMENYCIVRPLPFDNSDVDWEQCEQCALPCLLPRYSTDWAEIPGIVSSLNEQGYLLYLSQIPPGNASLGEWAALIVHREMLPAKYQWPRIQYLWGDIGWYAYGQDAPEAAGRAALKWAVDREAQLAAGSTQALPLISQ